MSILIFTSSCTSGAVYVFVRSGTNWLQQGYLKAANVDRGDFFGVAVSLSANGNTLAVGARDEGSNGSSPADNSVSGAGAVYIFTRCGPTWSQQAYIKPSTVDEFDSFGVALCLSSDGNTIAISAFGEDSDGTSESDNSAIQAGAAFIFTRNATGWMQRAFLKASNTDEGDQFGFPVSLSGDGMWLLAGASGEDSNGSLQTDNSFQFSGAAYVFSL